MFAAKARLRRLVIAASQGNDSIDKGKSISQRTQSAVSQSFYDGSFTCLSPLHHIFQQGDVVEITGFLDTARRYYIIEPQTVVIVERWKDKHEHNGQGKVRTFNQIGTIMCKSVSTSHGLRLHAHAHTGF